MNTGRKFSSSAPANKDCELRKLLDEVSSKNFKRMNKLLVSKNEEIAKLKLKTKELESQLEKQRRADQELKKRVLKLEFCLQEARSQTRKLQRIFNGVFLKVNKATVNMLRRVEPYVTFGYVSLMRLKEKKMMKQMSVVQDLADALMALADIRDGKGKLSRPIVVSCAGLLSAIISTHKNWVSC